MERDAAYLLLAWPLNLLAFLIVVPLVALGVGTVIIWVGLPVLVLSLAISAGFAAMGRRAAAAVDSSDFVPGRYLRAESGAGILRRLLVPLRDPQRWLDLVWIFVGLFVTAVTWALAVAWLAVAVLGVLAH